LDISTLEIKFLPILRGGAAAMDGGQIKSDVIYFPL